MNKKITFLQAVRIYQCNKRDRDMPYSHPIEELSRVHGTGIQKYWVLRDEFGMCGTVFFDGGVY